MNSIQEQEINNAYPDPMVLFGRPPMGALPAPPTGPPPAPPTGSPPEIIINF